MAGASHAGVKGFAAGLVLALGLGLAARAWLVAPLVDFLDPVVGWTRVLPGATLFSDGIGSFYVRTEKRREGKPQFWAFFLVTELGQGVPLDAYRAKPRSCDAEMPQAMVDHPAGTAWTQHYCFHLSARLMDSGSFDVVGKIGHRAWPFRTMVESTLPAFHLTASPVAYHNPFGGLR